MNGFLLAAGRGTRLKPLTDKTAKPALPVAGLPMLAYSLNFFFQVPIQKLAVNTHHFPQSITGVLKQIPYPWELKISHESELLDTGGGVKNCEAFLSDGPVLLANADIVADVDILKLLEFHQSRASALTIVVVPHPDADRIAPISLGAESQVVDINRTFNAKSTGEHLYAGVAIFEPQLFYYLKQEPSSIVYTGYTGLIAAGKKVSAFIHRGRWYDCGTPESYRAANNAVAADAWHWSKMLGPEIDALRNGI